MRHESNPESIHWFRPWCERCREGRKADQRLESELTGIQAEARDGANASLGRLLDMLGLPPVEVTEQQRERLRLQLRRLLPCIGIVLLVTTFAQPELVWREALERVHFGREADPLQSATFWLVLGLGWYFKPFIAFCMEWLMGKRRPSDERGKIARMGRGWIVGGTVVAGLCWFALGYGMHGAVSAQVMLWLAGGIGLLLAMVSVVMGGLLVEQGQRMGATGRLGAMHAAAIFMARLLGAGMPLLMGTNRPESTALACGFLLLGCALYCGYTLASRSVPANDAQSTPASNSDVAYSDSAYDPGLAGIWSVPSQGVSEGLNATWTKLLASRNVLGVAAIAALLYIAPNFVALQHAENLHLRFSASVQNNVDIIGAAGGLVGVGGYLWLCRRLKLQTMLFVGIVCNALGTLCYLGYGSVGTAYLIEGTNGILSALLFAMLFDLAIRAIPRGLAMPGYALLTGLIVFSSHLSNLFGSWLAVGAGWGFGPVVCLSSFLSLPALMVVTLLPASLLDRREGKIVIEALSVAERASGTALPSYGASR